MKEENIRKNLKTAALLAGMGIALTNEFLGPQINFYEQLEKLVLRSSPIVITRPSEVKSDFTDYINRNGGGTEMAINLAVFNSVTSTSVAGVILRPDSLSPLHFYPTNVLWPEYAEVRGVKLQSLNLKS